MPPNPTETIAKEWLASKGITVTFQPRRSPDFIADNGDGYEVKFIRNNTVTFFTSQLESLRNHPNCTILGFKPSATEPCLAVKFSELEIPGHHGKFRTNVVHTDHQDTSLFIRNLDDATVARIKRAAGARNMTLGAYITALSELHGFGLVKQGGQETLAAAMDAFGLGKVED